MTNSSHMPYVPPTPRFQNLQFKCELSVMEILGNMIVWVLLSLITFGLALFLFPYYMQRLVLNKTFAFDSEGKRVGRLRCTIDLASIIGNVILWMIISIITLGLGYFVFLYKINAHCMNHTRVVDIMNT